MLQRILPRVVFGGTLVAVVAGALVLRSQSSEAAAHVTVYKSPQCGCCKKWVTHLQAEGFRVTEVDTDDVSSVKTKYGIGESLASCHTALVEGYVVEGHVPASDIRRLLKERPKVVGIAAPGMPRGSPGMEGSVTDRYQVIAFTRNGTNTVYATH